MNLTELRELCNLQDDPGELPLSHVTFKIYKSIWKKFSSWLEENHISDFSAEEIDKFIIVEFNTSGSGANIPRKDKYKFTGINALKKYVLLGHLRSFRPSGSYTFNGRSMACFRDFLAEKQVGTSEPTLLVYARNLYLFSQALSDSHIQIDDIDLVFITDFLSKTSSNSNATMRSMKTSLRMFLRWCHIHGLTKSDKAIFVEKQKIIHDEKIPTTFTADESRLLLSAIDRASGVGKRDYAITLCISVYGWRASDVCQLRLKHIDWGKNLISFVQQKTNVSADFPLHPVIGNAIIDYLKYARPQSERDNVFLLMSQGHVGHEMHAYTINNLIGEYLRRAGITDLEKRKHGPHALRFSLATELVAKVGIPIDVTKSIMGHKNTTMTMNYVRLDIPMLRRCALPMPPCVSPFYSGRI